MTETSVEPERNLRFRPERESKSDITLGVV